MTPLRLAAWLVTLGVVVLSVSTYGTLPAEIPTHLGLDGRPDRFAERTLLRWFALPGLLVLLVALFALLARLAPSRPQMMNLPDKELLLELPSSFQRPVMRELVRILDAGALGIALVFGLIQWQFVSIATGRTPLPSVLLHLTPILMSVGLLVLVSRVSVALESAVKAWKLAGSPPRT